MDLKELEKLAKLCQKYGIRNIVTKDVTLSLDTITTKDQLQETSTQLKDNDYSDEDVLLWCIHSSCITSL